jgi:hypothetical protein
MAPAAALMAAPLLVPAVLFSVSPLCVFRHACFMYFLALLLTNTPLGDCS